MTLSRFAEHQRKQHWTGAFVELAIIVLDVLIALQVNSWSEVRQTAG